MGNFWGLSDNSEPLQTNGSFESGGGDFDPIPAKTQVLAAMEECKWDEYEGEEYINGKWNVFSPEAYKGRKVFQKIRVKDLDPKKRDKAIRMLTAIDANAGGKLMASGDEPTTDDLTRCLCNKPMMLMLQVWKNDDKQGNWVSAVAPKAGGQQQAQQQPVQQAQQQEQPAQQQGGFDDFDDDIPF